MKFGPVGFKLNWGRIYKLYRNSAAI